MSTLMKELKAEIFRLARKEIHKELAPVKRVGAAQRRLIAELRRQFAAQQKEVSALRKAASAGGAVPAAGGQEEGGRFWITGKGVKSLRKRLKLTQAELGRLAGVTSQAVINWEGTAGKIEFRRKETSRKFQGFRALNKKSAREILGKGAKAS